MNNAPAAPQNDRDLRLKAILAEYAKRREAGQTIDPESLFRAYPDLADGLRSYFNNERRQEDPALAATKLIHGAPGSSDLDTIHPGAGQSATASEFTSRKFGRYQLLRPLGEGAMGSVYLAQDTTLDRRVALKMPKNSVSDPSEFLTRFLREARAAAGLKHPHICSVFDAGEIDGTAYITMDFIDGVTLSRLIGTSTLQPVSSVLQMVRMIAEAVGHAHTNGVIHRDLKPGNILVDNDMQPFVTDFGLARRETSSEASRITQEGLLIGTPAYMAPEQVRGEQARVGVCSDIYSLGVILFEMLTTRIPFDGSVPDMLAKVLRDNPPVPSRLRKDLTEDVDDVVLRMLKKDPSQRYAGMSEVIDAIDRLTEKLNKSTTVAAAATTTERARSPFEIQKAHVELMLKKGQYATAIQELEKLAGEKAPGAKAVAEWARNTLPGVKAEAKALSPAGLAALLKTAQQLFEKSDYQGCMQLLEDVPPLKRTEPMEDLRKKAQQRETDAEQLLEMIKDKERRQDPDGLEPLVKKFLKIKPGSAYGKRLWQALQSYSTLPSSRRYYRFEKGRLQPMPEPSLFARWSVLALLVGVLTFLSVSYYVIIYLKSGSQTLAVHVDDEWLKSQGGVLTLVVDGDHHTITAPASAANGQALSIVVTLGEHTFSVKHGGVVVHDPKNFQIEKDGRSILQITPTDMKLTTAPELNQSRMNVATASGNSSTGNSVTAAATPPSDPWVSLFNGTDTSRWSALGPFQVKERMLIAVDGNARAISREEYEDFELEAEWRISRGGNGGIFYRELASTTWNGVEYQLIDSAHPGIREPSHRTGSLYGILAPEVTAENPTGRWNTTRIVCRGPVVEHWLNDRLLFRYDTTSQKWKDDLAASTLKQGKERIGSARRGHVLLQSQTGELAFRSIRIRELSPEEPASSESSNNPALMTFGNDNFSVIHNASPDEVLAWSKNLPNDLEPIWTSLRANSSVPIFDAVARKKNPNFSRKMVIVDADTESFEQPGLKGLTPGSIVTFQQDGKTRSLCLATTGKHPWQFWFGSTPLIRDKIREAHQKASSGKEEWPSVPLWVSSNHWQKNGGYYAILRPVPPVESAELLTAMTEAELLSRLQDARNQNRFPHLINFVNNGKSPPEFFAVLAQIRNQPVPKWSVSTQLDFETYQSLLTRVSTTAGKPRCVFSCLSNGRLVYNVLWDDFDPAELQTLEKDSRTQAVPATNGSARAAGSAQTDLDRIATGVWKPLVDSSTPLSDPAKMKFVNGVLELDGTSLRFPELNVRDVIVRADVRKLAGLNVGITVRHAPGKEWTQAYAAWFNGTQSDGGDLFGIAKARGTSISLAEGRSGHQFAPDQFVDMAVSAIGDEIALYVEGKKVHSAIDAEYGAGTVILGVFRTGKGLFRNVRYQSLDPPTPPGGTTAVPGNDNKAPLTDTAQPASVPFSADAAKAHQEAWAAHLKVPVEFTNSIGMRCRLIPPGTFTIGSSPEQIDAARPHVYVDPQDPDRLKRLDSEAPRQRVTLSKAFYLGVTEVTQGQFAQVMGRESPKNAEDTNRPAVLMTWVDTGEFCGRLTIHEKLDSAYRVTPELISQTGTGGYRLPTEAEWEFACRAGTDTLYSSGDSEESLAEVAWMGFNNEGLRAVGQRRPNPLGLFDMHGNAAEWVHDGWRPDAYQLMQGPGAVDPRNDLPVEGLRVIRGGSHFMPAVEGRSASRSAAHQDTLWGETGFRVALSVDAVRQLTLSTGTAVSP